MKTVARAAVFIGIALLTTFVGLIIHAGGWAEFKLRYAPQLMRLVYSETSISEAQQGILNRRPDGHGLDIETDLRISEEKLLPGGPPKDGIPSVDQPQFVSPDSSIYQSESSTPVIGVTHDGQAQAYPLPILNHHEIVNSTIGERNIAVTYCPLCDTYLVFDRGSTTYGVTGRLFQSCLVMYARDDDSLFVQPWGLGIAGVDRNKPLSTLPAYKTTLKRWLNKHPESTILSTETEYNRDYRAYPYGSYRSSKASLFPVRNQSARSVHPKKQIFYYWGPDQNPVTNHYTGPSLRLDPEFVQQHAPFTVELDGRSLTIRYDSALDTPEVFHDGEERTISSAFAFVYPALFTRKPHTLRQTDGTVEAAPFS